MAPTPVKAIYGGTSSSQSPYIGYMMVQFTNGKAGLCGVNFISPTVGLTAAHCVQSVKQVYPNIGEYTSSFASRTLPVESITSSPQFNPNADYTDAGKGDLAVIQMTSPASVSTYATIASPSTGCDYYIIGYGRDEKGQRFDRKIITTCISDITADRFMFKSPKAGEQICTGDSGTGIYRQNTNQLVGLVSSFESDTTCADAIAFYGTRVDAHINFIKQNSDYTGSVTGSTGTRNPSQSSTSKDNTTTGDSETNTDDQMAIAAVLGSCCCCLLIIGGILLIVFLRRKNSTPTN